MEGVLGDLQGSSGWPSPRSDASASSDSHTTRESLSNSSDDLEEDIMALSLATESTDPVLPLIEEVVPPPRKVRLPKWVTDSRAKVDFTQANLARHINKLSSLKASTEKLECKIMVYRKEAKEIEAKANRRAAQDSSMRTKHARMDDGVVYFSFEALPSDCMFILLGFLDNRDIAAYDCTSNISRTAVLDTQYYPELATRVEPCWNGEMHLVQRQRVVQYYTNVRICMNFIMKMKEDRSIPKERSVLPHIYSKKDREVAFPLPVFDPGSTGVKQILSRAETFSNDFTSHAINALESCCMLSSKIHDDIIFSKFVNISAVSVMVSILSNESKACQQLACVVLGNLFASEARRLIIVEINKQGKPGMESFSLMNLQEKRVNDFHKSIMSSELKSYRLVARQAKVCECQKVLFSLLSSPDARINLMTGGSSSVQGMSNKEASRALVNLFAPYQPVKPFDTRDKDNLNSLQALSTLTFPKVNMWRFHHYNRNGNMKDSYYCYLGITPDLYLYGRGQDTIGFFEMSGRSEMTIEGTIWLVYKCYLSYEEIFDNATHIDNLEDWYNETLSDSQALTFEYVKNKAHVVFCAYFSDYPTKNDRSSSYEFAQLGFFGTSEAAQQGASHFNLDATKGGVFRATPINDYAVEY